MSFLRALKGALSQPIVRRPVVDFTIFLDIEESNGIHNVYRSPEDDSITIFYSVPDNLATLTLELEPDSEDEAGEYLSSENFEDWEALIEIIPAWPIMLRRIETLYRQQIEEMTIDQNAHWDSDDEEDYDE